MFQIPTYTCINPGAECGPGGARRPDRNNIGAVPPKNIDIYIFLLHIYSTVCRVVKNTAIDPFWNVGNAISKRLECIKFQSSLQDESLQRPQTPSCIIDRYATSMIVLCPPYNFAPAPGLTCISCTELIIFIRGLFFDPK